jgi:hypothetical protein
MTIKWQLISKYPGINLIRVTLQDAGATSGDAALTVTVKLHFVFWNENCYSNGKDQFVPPTRKIIQ